MEQLVIQIARQGRLLGSFSEEEVRAGIASKHFSANDDLAWKSGMTEWRPLNEVMAARKSSALLSQGVSVTMASQTLMEPAWERRSELGFFKALFQTIFEVLFSPRVTFSKMKTTGGLISPLLFYVSTHVFLVPLAYLMRSQVFKNISVALPWLVAHASNPRALKTLDVASSISLQKIMMLELEMIFTVFIGAALSHLSLKILKSASRPFEATFRITCYSGAYAFIGMLFCMIDLAVGKLGFVPINVRLFIYVIEVLIGAIIGFGIFVIGLKKVHGISSMRAIFVMLLATLLSTLLVAAVAILVVLFILIVLMILKQGMH